MSLSHFPIPLEECSRVVAYEIPKKVIYDRPVPAFKKCASKTRTVVVTVSVFGSSAQIYPVWGAGQDSNLRSLSERKMDFETPSQRITSPTPRIRVTGGGFEGECAGNVHPTSLTHEAVSDGRRMPHNTEDSMAENSHLNSQSTLTELKVDCDKAAQRNPAQHPRSRLS